MLAFRSGFPAAAALEAVMTPLSPDALASVVADVISPAHFFVAPGAALVRQQTEEEIAWEIVRGRLLDPAHTAERARFRSWNLYWVEDDGQSAEPILSVKLDAPGRRLFVVRAIHCYAWEGYHAGDNVYLSRQTRKWVRELVATIALDRFAHAVDLRDELICALFQAVVGTSRLPLTSVQAPLPAFSFGRLAYCYRAGALPQAGPLTSIQQWIAEALRAELAWVEKAKVLEMVLRAVPLEALADGAVAFARRWRELGDGPEALVSLLHTLFNGVSLSPYTDFVERTITFLRALEHAEFFSAAEVLDFFASLLRQIGRHLTAFDLVTFHHRGANYPDALLLDTVLKCYLERAERRPDLFLSARTEASPEFRRQQLRRRALRQAWLLRRRYEGHLVPDAPTSQGENARVLPPTHPHIEEEQILNPEQRSRRLFTDDPIDSHAGPHAAAILRRSIDDLSEREELRELGTALFLDRPLGVGKHPVEPDHTPLLSYVAFSPAVAERRLRTMADTLHWIDGTRLDQLVRLVREEGGPPGLPLEDVPGPAPGVLATLADARKVAADFRILRTTRSAAREFFGLFDFGQVLTRYRLGALAGSNPVLIVRADPPGALRVHDAFGRKRMDLRVNGASGYASRAGVEYPVGGLTVLTVWEETDDPAVLREHDLRITPIQLGRGRTTP